MMSSERTELQDREERDPDNLEQGAICKGSWSEEGDEHAVERPNLCRAREGVSDRREIK